MSQRPFSEVAILLRPEDSVAVLKRPVKAGDEVTGGPRALTAAQAIPAGHKIAVTEIAEGAAVRKYGQTIGFATNRIAPGEHVHTHNLAMREFGRDYAMCSEARPVALYPAGRTFAGFARPGGHVGTRNYLA